MRVSVADALAIDTSLTMLASAAASAAASLAELLVPTPVCAVMPQSCQVVARVYCPSTAASVKPSRS